MGTAHATNPSGGVSAHADLTGLGADDHAIYALLAGRAGGQSLFGGTAAGELLQLQGSTHANRGRVVANGGLDLSYDWSNDFGTGALRWAEVIPSSGGAITTMLDVANSITVDNAVFIISALDDHSTIEWTVSPGFAVSTLFFARPTYLTTTAGIAPAQSFIYAAQAQYWNNGAGDITTPNYRGFSFAPIIRAEGSGDRMRLGATTGLIVQPLFNTRHANATADYGIIRGVHMTNAQQVLFGQALGTEIATDWIGIDVEVLSGLTVSGRRAGLRSALVANATNRFFENLSTALAEFGDGDAHFNDAGEVIFGTGNDISIGWDNAAGVWNWNPAVGEDLGIAFGLDGSKPTYLFEAENFGVSETNYTQIRYGFDRYAFGQTGSIGNQVGLFVSGNRTADVAGGWADYLLTQGGNINLGTFAMSDVSAWVLNPMSFDNSAYSISQLATLRIGGMTTSNPGGTVTDRAGLWTRGRTIQEGSVQYTPITPATLAAGDNDDWAGLLSATPNNNGRYWARVTPNASGSDLTGVDAGAVQDGDTFELTNIGDDSIRLRHENAGSVAANRFDTGPSGLAFVWHGGATVKIRYDGTDSRWRILTPPGAVAPLSGEWKFVANTTMADPGAGNFRTNNATTASVTALAINDTGHKEGDLSNLLGNLENGDRIYIQNEKNGDEYMIFDVTSTVDNTTWWQINGSVNESATDFTADTYAVVFIYT